MEIAVTVAVVVGFGVVVLWPLAKAYERRRSSQDQPQLTDTDEVPPRLPEEPIAGSRPHRRSHGKP